MPFSWCFIQGPLRIHCDRLWSHTTATELSHRLTGSPSHGHCKYHCVLINRLPVPGPAALKVWPCAPNAAAQRAAGARSFCCCCCRRSPSQTACSSAATRQPRALCARRRPWRWGTGGRGAAGRGRLRAAAARHACARCASFLQLGAPAAPPLHRRRRRGGRRRGLLARPSPPRRRPVRARLRHCEPTSCLPPACAATPPAANTQALALIGSLKAGTDLSTT